jgi:hypothetical protein
MSPTSLGFRFVFSINAYVKEELSINRRRKEIKTNNRIEKIATDPQNRCEQIIGICILEIATFGLA